MDGFPVAAFLTSPKKTSCKVELLVQAPDNTPLILHSGGYHFFPQSFSETLSLALAPLAIFIMTAQLKILGSFFFFFLKRQILSSAHFFIQTHSGRKQGQRSICCRKFCRSGRKDQKGPTEAAEIQLTPTGVLVISHGFSAESTTCFGTAEQKLKQVFLLG